MDGNLVLNRSAAMTRVLSGVSLVIVVGCFGCNSGEIEPAAAPQSPQRNSQAANPASASNPALASNPASAAKVNASDEQPRSDSEFDRQLASVQTGESPTLRLVLNPILKDQLEQLVALPSLLDLLLDAGGVDDQTMAIVGQLGQLEHLRIRESRISDAGLTALCNQSMSALEILNLPHAEVTARGVSELAKLPRLKQLRLGGPQLDDTAVARIAQLPNLSSLHLIAPGITDEALVHLAAAPKLASFYLDDCSLSDAAWQVLFDAKPNLHVHVDQHHHDRDPNKHDH